MRIPKGLSIQEVARRAYLAALVDGETYIGASRRSPCKKSVSPRYTIRVSLTMVDEGPVRFMADFCGLGHLVRLQGRRSPKHKPVYTFQIENHRAAALLVKLMPFLIGKKRQASLVLQLHALRQTSRRHRNKVTSIQVMRGGHSRGRPYRALGLSDAYLARCDALYMAMRLRNPTTEAGRANFGH